MLDLGGGDKKHFLSHIFNFYDEQTMETYLLSHNKTDNSRLRRRRDSREDKFMAKTY